MITGIVVLSSVVVLLISPRIYQGSLVLQMGNLERGFYQSRSRRMAGERYVLERCRRFRERQGFAAGFESNDGNGDQFCPAQTGFAKIFLLLTLRGRNPVLISEALDVLGSTFVYASRDRLKSQLDVWQERLSWQNRHIEKMEEVLWEAKRTFFSSSSMTQRRRQIASLERSYSDMVENQLAILEKIAEARPAQIYSAGAVGKNPVLPRYMDQLIFSAIVGIGFWALCGLDSGIRVSEL